MGAATNRPWESARAVDDNDRKERFSLAYISAVAAHAGCLVAEPPGPDKDSVDGVLMGDDDRRPRIEFQAKATSQRVPRGGHVTFRLPIKNYDDLRADLLWPRVLIVVVLPVDDAEWLVHSEEDLRIRRCGYWLSLRGWPATTNRRTVSVRIPRSQVFNTAQLREMMSRANRGEAL
jgi:hypothetical protein